VQEFVAVVGHASCFKLSSQVVSSPSVVDSKPAQKEKEPGMVGDLNALCYGCCRTAHPIAGGLGGMLQNAFLGPLSQAALECRD